MPTYSAFSALHRVCQRGGGLFHRRVFVYAVRIENIHILHTHAVQALVEAGEQVLT